MSEATLDTMPADPFAVPLDKINVSDPSLFEFDTWGGYFARLRAEAPVHYCAESNFGPFWSVSKFNDIVYVDKQHDVFSSEPTILLGDHPEDFPLENFISMNPSNHDE